MRYRVTRIFFDDGAFGYTASPTEEVLADWLDRAEAKAIYRHYVNKYWHNEEWVIELEVLYDGYWENVSQSWEYREFEEQEKWFDEKGLDYEWYLYCGKVEERI